MKFSISVRLIVAATAAVAADLQLYCSPDMRKNWGLEWREGREKATDCGAFISFFSQDKCPPTLATKFLSLSSTQQRPQTEEMAQPAGRRMVERKRLCPMK